MLNHIKRFYKNYLFIKPHRKEWEQSKPCGVEKAGACEDGGEVSGEIHRTIAFFPSFVFFDFFIKLFQNEF